MKGKPWYKSRGVVGAVVVIVAAIASIWGIDVGDQATLTDQLAGIIDKIVILVGAVVALIGRLKAKDKIKGFKDPEAGFDDVRDG